MDETTTQGALDAELVSAEELAALAPRSTESLATVSTGSDYLATLDRGGEVLAKKLAIEKTLTLGLLGLTSPEEWVLNRGADDTITGMPLKGAFLKMARFIGLEMRGYPEAESLTPASVYREVAGARVDGWELTFQVRSQNLNGGAWMPPLTATRWADEEFTGRGTDACGAIVKRGGVAALGSDLKAAVLTLAIRKGVAQLTGMGTAFGSQLLEVFKESGFRRCQKGHGFGTGTERGAQRVAEGGVPEKALALWEEILRRVGGDEESARGLLKEVTAYPAGINQRTKQSYNAFSGVDSYKAITRDVAVQQALRNLKAHAVFGDDTAREAGED